MQHRGSFALCVLLISSAVGCAAQSGEPAEGIESAPTPPPPPSKSKSNDSSGGAGLQTKITVEIDSCISYTENGGYSAVHTCFYSNGGVCTTRNEYIGKSWSGWSDYDCYGFPSTK